MDNFWGTTNLLSVLNIHGGTEGRNEHSLSFLGIFFYSKWNAMLNSRKKILVTFVQKFCKYILLEVLGKRSTKLLERSS